MSVRPSVRLSVRPSVRPERFPGICRRTHGGNGLKFCMLMYLGHLQNWLDYGHGLLIFLLLASLWLSEMSQCGVSGHFPENAWWEWPKLLHADVSWPPSELISLWLWSVDFFNFGVSLLCETGQIWVSGHFLDNPLRKWPDILHAAVSCWPLKLVRLWSGSVDFSNFGGILT